MTDHTAACRWERTTSAECEYRETHHYCPHPEHACDCATPRGTPDAEARESPQLTAAEAATIESIIRDLLDGPDSVTDTRRRITALLLSRAASREAGAPE